MTISTKELSLDDRKEVIISQIKMIKGWIWFI